MPIPSLPITDAILPRGTEFEDGYYLHKKTGEVLSRVGMVWYYWSTPHGDWKFFQEGDDTMVKNYLLRIGRLGVQD